MIMIEASHIPLVAHLKQSFQEKKNHVDLNGKIRGTSQNLTSSNFSNNPFLFSLDFSLDLKSLKLKVEWEDRVSFSP